MNDEEMTAPVKDLLKQPKVLQLRTKLRDERTLLIALHATGHVDMACTKAYSTDRMGAKVRDIWTGFELKPSRKASDGRTQTIRAYDRSVLVALERVLRSVFREAEEAQTWHRDVEAWARALVRREGSGDKRTVEALVVDARVRAGFHPLAWGQEVGFGVPDGMPIREAMEEEAQKLVLARDGAA